MKRIVSFLLLLTLLLTGVLSFSSCGTEDDGAQISVYLTDRVWGFDPAADVTDDSVQSVMYLLYEPLFSLDDDGDVHPALAKKYDYDKETATLTVTLRETYWSSGARVLASDVIYAWKRLLNPGNSFSAATLLYDIRNAKSIKNGGGALLDDLGVYEADMGTALTIAFEDPDTDVDAFLRNLTNIATAPVNYRSVEGQPFWSNGTSSVCYTNGPFKIRDLDNSEGYFTLARNDGYHREEESKKAVDYFVLPYFLRTQWNIDSDTTDTAHTEEQYDILMQKVTKAAEKTVFYMAELSLTDRAAAQKDAEVNDSLSTYTYVFDTTNPLFESSEVRSVLSKVLDREYMVSLVTFAKPATGFVSYGVWNATSSSKSQSFRKKGGDLISPNAELSTADAKAQLDALGAERGAFTLTYQQREDARAIAEYVKGQWEALGYTVTLEPITYYTYQYQKDNNTVDEDGNPIYTTYHTSALQYRYAKGDFDVIGIDYQMMSTNAVAVLATMTSDQNGNGVDYEKLNQSADKNAASYLRGNAAGYANSTYNELISTALQTANLKDRAAVLHQAEELLISDMPVIPLLFNQSFYVANTSYLKGLEVNYYGYTLFTDAKLKKYQYFYLDVES